MYGLMVALKIEKFKAIGHSSGGITFYPGINPSGPIFS